MRSLFLVALISFALTACDVPQQVGTAGEDDWSAEDALKLLSDEPKTPKRFFECFVAVRTPDDVIAGKWSDGVPSLPTIGVRKNGPFKALIEASSETLARKKIRWAYNGKSLLMVEQCHPENSASSSPTEYDYYNDLDLQQDVAYQFHAADEQPVDFEQIANAFEPNFAEIDDAFERKDRLVALEQHYKRGIELAKATPFVTFQLDGQVSEYDFANNRYHLSFDEITQLPYEDNDGGTWRRMNGNRGYRLPVDRMGSVKEYAVQLQPSADLLTYAPKNEKEARTIENKLSNMGRSISFRAYGEVVATDRKNGKLLIVVKPTRVVAQGQFILFPGPIFDSRL